MLQRILTEDQVVRMKELVGAAQHVAVTCHIGPDGDAVGSMSAVLQLLQRLDKEAVGIVPNAFPDFLRWLPLADQFVVCEKEEERAREILSKTDLIICLDHNSLGRMGNVLSVLVEECQAKRVMIDHHLDPDPQFCGVMVSRPDMCSACEVLLHVMCEMGWADGMTHDEAVSIYTGMMTDTGAFTYASSRPEVYDCISMLLQKGIDKDKIYRNIYWTSTEGRLQLMGYLLYVKMELMREDHAALITLTNEEYRRFAVKNGDTEGFVNLPLQIDGMKLSIFLREDTEVRGKIRVSARSVDDFPCNQMAAEFFNGGGHKNAAGGSLMCSMDEAVEIVRKAIKKYEPLLKQS